MFLSHKPSSKLYLGKSVEELPLQRYEKGDEIVTLDSEIWQIYRGVVQLSRVQLDGTEVVVGWVTSNGVFGGLVGGNTASGAASLGEHSLAPNGDAGSNRYSRGRDLSFDSLISYRAVALGDVYARRYAAQDISRYPQLGRQFLSQFSDRLLKSQHLLTIIAIKKVEDRLKNLLLLMKQEIGQPVSDGVRLQVRFTHQHLAEAINTTRVTVTRTLGDFQRQELLYIDGEKHIVLKS